MQGLESVQHLDRKFPYVSLVDRFFSLLVGLDEAAEVTAVCEFRDEKEASCILVVYCFFVGEDVGVGNAGKDADLIEAVGDFS
jgi:hypothetical protein